MAPECRPRVELYYRAFLPALYIKPAHVILDEYMM